jgi:hypothetical protein
MSNDDANADNEVPVIISEYGRTTEWCRRQAVLNMRRDPALLARMIAQFGEARIRRDYPEVWMEDGDASASS